MLRRTQEGWITQITFESLKRYLTFVSPGESLFHHFKEGQTFVHRFKDEPIKCCDPPCELLDFFDGLGWCHVEDGLHLLRVRFYSSLRHHESQKLSWGYTKSTLTGVHLHLYCLSVANVSFRSSRCVNSSLLLMSMSSTYTSMFLPICLLNILFTSLW